MPTARFKSGSLVFSTSTPPFVGKVLSTRLRMEDETFIHIVKDLKDPDHIETIPEKFLSEVETLPEVQE